MSIIPYGGILLYGAPGTGKTLIAKAIATELHASFISLQITDLIHGEVGESERALAEAFRLARCHSPCIVFIDELQAVFTIRDTENQNDSRLVSQLMVEIDMASSSGVIVLAATNLPNLLDASLLIPGRIDCHIYVPPPDKETRAQILRFLLRDNNAELLSHVDDIADSTEFFSGADLVNLLNVAALQMFYENEYICNNKPSSHHSVSLRNFKQALQVVTPSISSDLISHLESFHANKS